MEFVASHRFARISAQKVRPIADLIRGKSAEEAVEILRFLPHRGAKLMFKVLKSAIANAEDRRAANVNSLVVSQARVDGGPMFKRIQPHARGMAFGIKKRFSHIHVAVEQVGLSGSADNGDDGEE